MASARRALAGFAALAFAALPSAEADVGALGQGLFTTRNEVDEPVSLLQTSVVLGEEAASAKHTSSLATGAWPNPADPNMKVTPWQASVISNLKANPLDMQQLNRTVTTIATTPVSYVVEHGGYDILFGALHNFANDSTVQMSVFRGLSDQSHTEIGSNYIANYGGPNEGIVYMVEQLKAHPTAYDADCADHLTYQYEVLQCLSGLLKWDVNGTRGAAAVDAGLLEATLHAMDVEYDRRPTQDVACKTLAALVSHDPSYAGRLKELGAEKLVRRAISRYNKYDTTPFIFGTTYGQMYPVTPGCMVVSLHLRRAV